jgi:tRNA-dihydrouridine synthase B
MYFDWKTCSRPIIAMSPMDGYTDSAFRQLVKEIEPRTLIFTEFVSADAIAYAKGKARKVIEKIIAHSDLEVPLIGQIFGKIPENFAKAAKIMEELGLNGIDINMGCPARKVVGSGHGSALIKTPFLSVELVKAVRSATKLPLSVKTRLGTCHSENLIEFCTALQEAGAEAITIHGRTVSQEYSGLADWNPIYELKKHLKIPVLGNGDIRSLDDFQQKLYDADGNVLLDGVMIGRGALGNPWIFSEIFAWLDGKQWSPLLLREKLPWIFRHAELLVETKGERVGMLEMRKHLASAIKGIPGASELRQRCVRVEKLCDVKEILDEISMNQ